MWVNCINLNACDIDDFVNGDVQRESVSICAKLNAVVINDTEFTEDKKGYLIVLHVDHAYDPKFHFLEKDKDKAYALYGKIARGLMNDDHEMTIEALEEGAI